MGRWIWVVLLIGCGEPDSAPDAAVTPTFEPMTVTLRLTGAAREDAEGRMRGVDLDGRVSDATDELGCLQKDWTDPIGDEPGVDDNYYSLVVNSEVIGPAPGSGTPTIDEMIASAVITVDVAIEPAPGGARVTLGDAEPTVVPFQDGHFQALTGTTLDATVEPLSFAIHDLAVDGVLTPDGELTSVVIAGALDVAEIVATAEAGSAEVDPDLLRATLENVADLDPGDDGRCTRVSAVFTAAVEP